MKDAIEKQNKRFSQELKENALDSSEKANQLSLYIDDQIKQLTDDFFKKNEKMKQIFTKLAEQFKNHLITYDASKRELVQKTTNLEKAFEDERLSTTLSLKNIENNLKNLIKESKYELETLLLSKFSVLADKCLKLQEQLNSDVDLLKETNDNTRAMLLNKINKLIENYGVIHKTHYENFNSLLGLVNELKTGVLVLDSEINQNMNEICNKIVEDEAKNEMRSLTEKTIRENQFADFFNLLRETADNIHQGLFNLKVMVENEERTRLFEKQQHFEGFEQLNSKIDAAKIEFDSFFNDFKVN